MKIVDVSAFYSPQGGGVKNYSELKLQFGPQMGHEIILVVPGERDFTEVRSDGARIISIASPRLIFDRRYHYFADADAVHAILDRERPDFVEASSPWRTASIIAHWNGYAPRALVMHADPLAAYAYRWFGAVSERATIDRSFEFFWRYLRNLGRRFDRVVCANSHLSGRLIAGGVEHVQTIPFGIESGIFSPSLRDEMLREQLLARCALPPDALLLLGVGRLSAEKRWDTVIDACVRAGAERKVGLVLAGDGRDKGKLLRHIKGNPHIQLLGAIRERGQMARIMASADALIHGCEAETFGLVAFEAAASGLPIIVPDEGGARDAVTAATGEIYRAADARAAARFIARLADRDRASLREAGRQHARNIPTIEQHFRHLFAEYEAIIVEHAQAARRAG